MQLDSIYLLDRFLQLRLLRSPLPRNHLQLEPVDFCFVQLVSNLLDRFVLLRFPHGLLLSNHHQLEPVDI